MAAELSQIGGETIFTIFQALFNFFIRKEVTSGMAQVCGQSVLQKKPTTPFSK